MLYIPAQYVVLNTIDEYKDMKSDDLIEIIAGFAGGDTVADSLVDDDSPITKLGVGLVSGAVIGSIAKTVSKETGISEVLDDIFGF